MLEWVGDIGGLFDGLSLIVRLIIAPVAAIAMKAKLLSQLFRLTASDRLVQGGFEEA